MRASRSSRSATACAANADDRDRALTLPSAGVRGARLELPAAMRSILLLVALGSVAAADPYDIGFRVGGYGFHREGGTGSDAWSQCRMNGMGVFGTRALR